MADRAAIRQALEQAIIDGDTAAGARVSSNRARAVWHEGLPAVLIALRRDAYEEHSQAPRVYRVTTQVDVVLFVEEGPLGPADDQLDALYAEVLAVLFQDPQLGIDDLEIRPTGFESDYGQQGKRRLGGGTITCDAVHFVEAPQGDPADLGAFALLHVDHALQPDDGQLDAMDDVSLPQ